MNLNDAILIFLLTIEKEMETFAIETDCTLFSILALDFEGWILYVLSQAKIPGVPWDVMEKFHRGYAASAFRCRYPFCRTSSNGFATAALRRQHEGSHFTRIYCSTTSCPWHRIGFKDQNSLRNHIRCHHSKDTRRLAPANARLLPPTPSMEFIRKQNRLQLEDDWPPVFSYNRKEDAKSFAEKYLDKVSPKYVRQGKDWFAFFEPHQPRILDIEAVHTLPQSSHLQCICLSLCGLYLAIGSNQMITLYNVATGTKIREWQIDHDDEYHYVVDILFHPESTRIVSTSTNSIVQVCPYSLILQDWYVLT